MFHKQSMGHMCVVVDEELNRDIFEQWLMREGYKAQIYEFLDTSDPVVKAEKVHLLTTSFGRAGWYIDNDPRTLALTIAKGIPSLLVGSPFTIRPEWEESGRQIRPWDELVSEMDRQHLKKVQKAWTLAEEVES